MRLIKDSTDKLESLKPYVGNATKNIEIIKNLGKNPESIEIIKGLGKDPENISLDKLFTIQSFRDNFKSSLMIVYSLLGLI